MTGHFKVLAVGLVALATPAFAQTQVEMTAQAAQEFRKADDRLNEVYRALLPKLPSDDAAKLREVQLTWLRFRDQECAFETMGTLGGSAHPMVEIQCQAILTRERVRQLEQILKCPERGLACD